MLPVERRKEILAIIREKGSVSVNELSSHFSVSEETIRRDLQQMENESLLSRAYGGAYLSDVVRQDVPFRFRKDTCRIEKEKIANSCLQFIQSGDTIFLDSSTTALYLAEKVRQIKNITVITNALHVAYVLSECPDIKVICGGGELNSSLHSFTSWATLNLLERYYADKAFISCTGLSLTHGLTDSHEMQGRIRCTMLRHSQKKYLIVDNTKFNKTTLTQIATLDDIEYLICDKQPTEEWITELTKRNIKVIYD